MLDRSLSEFRSLDPGHTFADPQSYEIGPALAASVRSHFASGFERVVTARSRSELLEKGHFDLVIQPSVAIFDNTLSALHAKQMIRIRLEADVLVAGESEEHVVFGTGTASHGINLIRGDEDEIAAVVQQAIDRASRGLVIQAQRLLACAGTVTSPAVALPRECNPGGVDPGRIEVSSGGNPMPSNPPENMPRITPYLLYEDVESALAWLTAAFGLQERMRLPGPDGRASHAEMALQDGVVMMGRPGPEYRNPKRTGHVAQELYVYVDDVDAHYARAKRAGATILEEPTDQFYGDRRYRAADPEGHHWCFATHVRDVSAEEMRAAK